MLTYAYECDQCGEFEKEQSITEAKLKTCPTCGGKVRRLISGGAGFMMSGGASSFGGDCDQASSCSQAGSHCGKCSCH